MKKGLCFALLAMFLPVLTWAQFTFSGKVLDARTKAGLVGATVSIGSNQTLATNAQGLFSFTSLAAGNYVLKVSFVGYQAIEKTIVLPAEAPLEIVLKPTSFSGDEVLIKATRATEQSATTYTNLSKAVLEKNNTGQDLPFVLNQTAGVVVSSDAGTGIGYTGLRIRGSDASRINVTLNGIPFNDPESQATYFVNLPDFVSSVDNIQVQRGVGTSTNGAGAFGASINIQTTVRKDSAYTELNNSFGSYNTQKNTLNFGTGLLNNQFTFDGRLSRIQSDGYIDRASSKLKSYFLSGAWYGANTLIRANVFSGHEKTYQAWNGVPEWELANNRTYNAFTYEDQTDNYTQDHYQLLYAHSFSSKLSLSGAFHYTYGRGYYEEFKADQDFADYGLSPLLIGGNTISQTDLIRRRWLDNDFYGSTFALNYTPKNGLDFTLGGAYNEYKGRHFGEIIWATYASDSQIRQHYYDNDGFKTDFNVYGKSTWQRGPWVSYADLQYRRVSHEFVGYDTNLQNIQQAVSLNFFNPKVGLSYQLNPQEQLYASLAVANKEPNRNDFVSSTPASRPVSERLTDVEAGYRFSRSNFRAALNGYFMKYKNQLILTGAINDVGEYSRSNVPDSYRFGLELDASLKLSEKWAWKANIAWSRNKIKRFTNYIDDYDNSTQIGTVFTNTAIAFSPAVVASGEWDYVPFKNAEIAFIGKYVSRQYLDNTANKTRQLKEMLVHNLRFQYNFSLKSTKNLGLTLLVNNVFNKKYEANGYTFSYISGGNFTTENYYYPQATRNFLISLNLKF
jgi:iron complex outermembrane receptor protein